jgi:hypothetical protein
MAANWRAQPDTPPAGPAGASQILAKRIYLSPPHMSARELDLVRDAFESNWISPCGPHLDAFEREVAEIVSGPDPQLNMVERRRPPRTADKLPETTAASLHAAALSSGTAALHLALRMLANGRGAGDDARGSEVLCSTLTFAASVNVTIYEGLVPVFIDSDARSWNMDPDLLREELEACADRGKRPRAVIVVDLYGQCADYDPILAACAEHEVPVIEDAAEALGAIYWGQAGAEAKVKATVKGEEKAEAKAKRGSGPGAALTSAFPRARSAAVSARRRRFRSTGTRSLHRPAAGCWCLATRQSPTRPGSLPRKRKTRPRTISIPKLASTTG